VLSTVQSNEVISWSGTRVVNGLTFQSNSNYTLGASPGTVANGGEGIELTSIDGVPTGGETDTVNINGYYQSGQGTVTINAEIQVQFSALTLSVNNYLNAPMVFNGDMIGPGNMTLTAGGMTINGNDQMTGNLIVQAGTLQVGSTGQVGAANEFLVAPGATVKLDSGSAVVANAWMSVGSSAGGTGTLNISGASVTANTDFNIGDVTGSSGVVDMTGGSINCTNFYLGKSGTATGLLVQTGGSIAGLTGSGTDWRIGGAASTSDATAVGVYNLSGGTFTDPVNLQVGAYGHGTVNQTAGTASVAAYLSIGRFGGSVGVYNMASGSGTLTANTVASLIVGEQGTGTLLVGGSSHVNAKVLSIAQSDGTGATGTVNQTGGTVTATGGVIFGQQATGTAVTTGAYTLSGGTLAAPFVAENPGSTATSTFNFNGGVLQPTTVAPALFQGITNLRVQAGGAIINATGIHLTLGQTLTHDPALGSTPDGGLTKGGFNTLTINAPQAYTGVTTVSAGTLQLSAVPSLPDIGEISDLDASTLALSNGSSVTSLTDSSPVKNNAAVTVAGDYPTFTTNSLNGMGTIHFNGSSQGLTTAANTGITGNSARTLFVIDRRATGDTVNTQVGATASSADYGISDSNGNLYLPYSYNNDITTTAQTANTWRLYATVHNPSATTADIGYVNGVQTTTGNLTLNTTNSPVQIGYRTGDTAQSDGDVAEVIVYDVALTTAQIQTVDEILENKWFGASLPAVSNLLPTTGTVNITSAGSTFDLNGVNQTLGSLNGVSSSLVRLGTATLTINNTAADTFNGNISGAGGLTKTAGGLLTLGGTSTYTGATNILAGTVAIAPGAALVGTPLTVAAGATLNITGSLSATTPLADNGVATFTANTTATPLARPVGAVTVGPAATLTVSPEINHNGRLVVQAASLTMSPTATLNLGNNDLDITAASLQTITSLVANGYNLPGGGTWSGAGISSTTAAADTSHLTALGVIQNNQNGSPIYSSTNLFDTTSPGAGDVLVKYTYFGDANLDGTVDGSDYSLIDAGYASQQPGSAGPALTGWLNGDFNYDGTVDGSDYSLIDNAFNNQTANLSTSSLVATVTAQTAAVPEPAAAAVALLAAGFARRPRRLKTV
jgi:autotransporter-associated beta strand protein